MIYPAPQEPPALKNRPASRPRARPEFCFHEKTLVIFKRSKPSRFSLIEFRSGFGLNVPPSTGGGGVLKLAAALDPMISSFPEL